MSLLRTLELRSSDADALCCLFVDGALAGLGRGVARARIRTGQRIRYFIRRRRGAADWILEERLGKDVWVIGEGQSARALFTGSFEAQRRRRTPAALGSLPGPRAARPRGGMRAVARKPTPIFRGLLPPLEG